MERTPKDKLSKAQAQSVMDELMTCKLRETESVTKLKQLNLKVMELETASQITSNQVGDK